LPYKLDFEATNNLYELEALILCLEATRKMQAIELVAFGESNLLVQKIKSHYEIRNLKMRVYKNKVWDLVDNFYEYFKIIVVSIEFNQQVDSLVVEDSTFKTHVVPKMKYEIEMRNRQSIPDNIKYWKVFEDDQ
jgi:ribonuclease HI